MKRIIILSLALLTLIVTGAFAQAPNLMNYQGIARDAQGNPLASQGLGLRITIHNGSSGGASVYEETQNATTNAYGLYTLQIGAGTTVSGNMSTINWASGSKYVQVEMDPAGGTNYTDLGASQLLSVPYAMYSAKAGNVPANIPTVTGTANYIAKFTGANNVGNSGIVEVNSHEGIGTTSPLATLDVESATDSLSILGTTSTSYESIFGVVRGEYNGTNSTANNVAVFGSALPDITANNTFGVEGVGSRVGAYGICESSQATPAQTVGTEGDSYGDGGYSVGTSGFSFPYVTGASTGMGIYGYSEGAVTNYAGYFDGNVYVGGTLSKLGGSFKIDDPMDPANKYLSHSFVESPDMMNVYNGNITTDVTGTAIVTLPSYFETLNKDFRYQLTVIGTFAQAIVGEKVHNNKFVIKTNQPDVEVSWQVTGIRQDPWANAHRIPNESDKESFNKGKYLDAKDYNMPESAQIGHLRPNKNKNDKTFAPIQKQTAK